MVVNSTNIRLTPEDGAVEKAIQKAAGERVTEACRKLYPKGISTNGLAVTDSFDMQTAKKIFHIALSSDVYKVRFTPSLFFCLIPSEWYC